MRGLLKKKDNGQVSCPTPLYPTYPRAVSFMAFIFTVMPPTRQFLVTHLTTRRRDLGARKVKGSLTTRTEALPVVRTVHPSTLCTRMTNLLTTVMAAAERLATDLKRWWKSTGKDATSEEQVLGGRDKNHELKKNKEIRTYKSKSFGVVLPFIDTLMFLLSFVVVYDSFISCE